MKKYFSFVTFSHSVFALPFAIIGYILALEKTSNHLSFKTLLLVLGCMVFARNAAMSFNRIVDRKIDEKNKRTQNREIPSGKIGVKEGVLFCLVNCFFFVLLTFFINSLCFYLSFVALAVILGYSYSKRFTWLCHWILGTGLGLAPIGAYLTILPSFDTLPLLFSFCVLFWVAGFDILYALQDEKIDRELNLFSVPKSFGYNKALQIARFSHILSSIFLLITLRFNDWGIFYFLGVLLFLLFLIYQHRLVFKFGTQKINRAFFTANGFSSVVFFILFALDRWV